MLIRRLATLARPLPRGGWGLHAPYVAFGLANAVAGAFVASQRWEDGPLGDSAPIIIGGAGALLIAVGVVLVVSGAAAMLAARGRAPALFVVTSRGESLWVTTPYPWTLRVVPRGPVQLGVDEGAAEDPADAVTTVWARSVAGGRVSLPVARPAHGVRPALVVRGFGVVAD